MAKSDTSSQVIDIRHIKEPEMVAIKTTDGIVRYVPNPKGRPTKLQPDTVNKIIAALHNGYNKRQVCRYSGISPTTYYKWLKENPDFLDTIALAKEHPSMKARSLIMEAMNSGDWRAAAWWLERKDKDEFSTRAEVTGPDNGPIQVDVTWVDEGGAKDDGSGSNSGQDEGSTADNAVHEAGTDVDGEVHDDGSRPSNGQDAEPR